MRVEVGMLDGLEITRMEETISSLSNTHLVVKTISSIGDALGFSVPRNIPNGRTQGLLFEFAEMLFMVNGPNPQLSSGVSRRGVATRCADLHDGCGVLMASVDQSRVLRVWQVFLFFERADDTKLATDIGQKLFST